MRSPIGDSCETAAVPKMQKTQKTQKLGAHMAFSDGGAPQPTSPPRPVQSPQPESLDALRRA